MTNILIIEDDITFSQILESFLRRNNYEVLIKHSIQEGVSAIKDRSFDLVLLDYRLPDGTGQDVLEFIHKESLQLSVVIMTSFNDIRTAVKMVKMGAYDYITKPVNPDELLMIVKEALARKEAKPVSEKESTSFVAGQTEAARQIQTYIQLVAPTDISVIVQGDSGTGKEQVARSIHNQSKRIGKPFIAIDCGALSNDLAASELFGHTKGSFTGALLDKKGQFEVADGGTLFMDEVGNLSYEVQVKLLRALQEREIQPVGSNKIVKVDVRIVTATNDDLINSVKNGTFREDLYHRLNEFKIQLLPLRERSEDMPLFIEYFIKQSNKEFGKQVQRISPEVNALFQTYDWPGNLRELKNIIKRAVLLTNTDTIELETLPEEMAFTISGAAKAASSDLKQIQSETERELIEKTLKEVKYNKSKAAKLLNIDRTTLYYKMAKYGIE